MSLFSDVFNPLALQGETGGMLAGRQQAIAQQNVVNQQAIERYNIDQMMERQARQGSLQYANSIGEKLLDPNFRADAQQFGTLPGWEEMQTRHYLYGSGGYPVDILNRDTPLPQSTNQAGNRGTRIGDEEGAPPPNSGTSNGAPVAADNGTGGTPNGNPDEPLNIILPASLGGGGGADTGTGSPTPPAPGTPTASTDTGATASSPGSFLPGSPLPTIPAASVGAGTMAGLSRLAAVDAADTAVPNQNEGTPPVASAVQGSRETLPSPGGTGQPYPATQVSAGTTSIKVPAPGTQAGVDAGLFQNQLMPALEAARQVMDGNYSSDRRLAAAAQYTSTMTQMLGNQLEANQIVQLREEIALIPAKARAALIESLAKAAGDNANAQATLALIDPTAAKFYGEAAQSTAEAGLLGEQQRQLPRQVGAQVATAHAANISAQASLKEAQVRQNELNQQVTQWGQAPGRAAASTYFSGLVGHLYETRTHQMTFGVGGNAKAVGGLIGAGGHGTYGGQETYTVLNTGAAVALVAAGFPSAWAALSQARLRGVDTPGGSSTPIPDDDTLRGAVLSINGAQAALQAAGPPGSKGYQQVYALIQKGQKWLSTVPASLSKAGPSSPDNAMPGKTYDTGGIGGNSVSDQIQGGILGAGKTAGSLWNFLNTPLPGTLHGKK